MYSVLQAKCKQSSTWWLLGSLMHQFYFNFPCSSLIEILLVTTGTSENWAQWRARHSYILFVVCFKRQTCSTLSKFEVCLDWSVWIGHSCEKIIFEEECVLGQKNVNIGATFMLAPFMFKPWLKCVNKRNKLEVQDTL